MINVSLWLFVPMAVISGIIVLLFILFIISWIGSSIIYKREELKALQELEDMHEEE